MNPDTAVQDGIDEVPLCLAWSKRGGVCGQKLPCDGSLHREPTFEEQVDSHFARLEAERTPSVALVEERTGEDAPRAFELSDDQLCALRELLALVHYDDLADSWLMLLPSEFFPRGRGEQR